MHTPAPAGTPTAGVRARAGARRPTGSPGACTARPRRGRALRGAAASMRARVRVRQCRAWPRCGAPRARLARCARCAACAGRPTAACARPAGGAASWHLAARRGRGRCAAAPAASSCICAPMHAAAPDAAHLPPCRLRAWRNTSACGARRLCSRAWRAAADAGRTLVTPRALARTHNCTRRRGRLKNVSGQPGARARRGAPHAPHPRCGQLTAAAQRPHAARPRPGARAAIRLHRPPRRARGRSAAARAARRLIPPRLPGALPAIRGRSNFSKCDT